MKGTAVAKEASVQAKTKFMIKPTLIFSLILTSASALLAENQAATTRMPVVTSTAPELNEEQPVDETGRPEWTSARRFPGSRVYIQQAPWDVGVEQWWRIHHNRDNTIDHRLLSEIEIGLPYRFQLDIYGDFEGDNTGAFHYQQTNVELRYALADWNKIWGNPTLYAEYKFADEHGGPDVYELKLLLGGDIAPRWHWALNFVWEAEIGGEREQEFQVTSGLSYSVIDRLLGVGVETKYDNDTVRYHRGDPENQFLIGPSVQLRLTDRSHVDLSCMFGTNEVSQRQEAFVVVGYDFGRKGESHYTPVTGQGR